MLDGHVHQVHLRRWFYDLAFSVRVGDEDARTAADDMGRKNNLDLEPNVVKKRQRCKCKLYYYCTAVEITESQDDLVSIF